MTLQCWRSHSTKQRFGRFQLFMCERQKPMKTYRCRQKTFSKVNTIYHIDYPLGSCSILEAHERGLIENRAFMRDRALRFSINR